MGAIAGWGDKTKVKIIQNFVLTKEMGRPGVGVFGPYTDRDYAGQRPSLIKFN